MIFLSAPHSINPDAAKSTMRAIKAQLETENPDLEFFIPHLEIDPRTPYREARLKCFEVLATCSQIWLVGPPELSLGVEADLAFAKACGIRVIDKRHMWAQHLNPIEKGQTYDRGITTRPKGGGNNVECGRNSGSVSPVCSPDLPVSPSEQGTTYIDQVSNGREGRLDWDHLEIRGDAA